MADLLLELFCEEIPARMQARGAEDLRRLMLKGLAEAGLEPETGEAHGGPRRLVLSLTGLPAVQPDRREERKGPRVGAPEKAVEGFLRAAGLDSLEACETREDKKGQYYVAVTEVRGRPTGEVIAELVPDIVRDFPWPKSQRWGAGRLRWVRPLHAILCVFDGEVVAFDVDGVRSGETTWGHRVHGPAPITVRTFPEYEAALADAKVVVRAEARRKRIEEGAGALCAAEGLELVDDPGLLDEVTGLVEWPVPLMGRMDPKFLELPGEVLTSAMRKHQKYFSVRDPKTGGLAPRFVVVANLEADDGGAAVTAGNERVLTARLSDARFLWDQDRKTKLEGRLGDLDKITFFEGLGSVGDKAQRVAALARELAAAGGAGGARRHTSAAGRPADDLRLRTGRVPRRG
ncbi:MAG: glycine--tRNA ligase subunit beta, partial [Pseudomonadota bacterium]